MTTMAVHNALCVSVERHGEVEGGLIEGVFLLALKYLSAKRDSTWVNEVWHLARKSSLFRDLKPEQVDMLIASLAVHPRVDVHVEELVAAAASSCPTKVIDFFGARLKAKKTSDRAERYEAIPYQLNKLRPLLASQTNYVVKAAWSWFQEDKQLFTYRGGRLLSIVYPQWSEEFESALQRTVDTHERARIEFIVEVLHNYEGEPFTHSICQRVVDVLPTDDPLLNTIGRVLDATGVVSGEFGLAEAFRRKKAEIEPWLQDPREQVRLFAKRHILALEREIATEQRRGEETLEMRKREYGKNEPNDA